MTNRRRNISQSISTSPPPPPCSGWKWSKQNLASKPFSSAVILLVSLSLIILRIFSNSRTGIASVFGPHIEHGDPALAVTLRSAVSESELQRLEALIDVVESSGPAGEVKQRRAFGTGDDHEVGHEVTYLHQHASQDTIDLFWNLAVLADTSMPAWDIIGRAQALGRPSLRCMEAIRYYIKPETADGLSWHHDGSTLYTVIVALHTAGSDFHGGELEFRNHESGLLRVADLRRGDVVVWRGWDMHRVRPVSWGHRTVAVAEWWLGQRCSADEVRPVDSEDVTRQTITLDKSSTVLHEILADHLIERADNEGADAAWRRVLQLDPLHVRAHYNRGKFMDQIGDSEGAMKSYAEALRIDGRYADAHVRQGMIHTSDGNLVEANESYHRAIWVDPLNADAHHDVGIIAGSLGDLISAESSFQMALSIDTQHAGAHYNLGLMQASRGDLAEASKSFQASLRSNPEDADAHEQLGIVRSRMGSVAAARKV